MFAGRTSVSHERNTSTILRATHRNHWRITRPDQWSNYGTLRRLFGKKLLFTLRPLRKKCCPECKDAHMDILRREIIRINSQVIFLKTKLIAMQVFLK